MIKSAGRIALRTHVKALSNTTIFQVNLQQTNFCDNILAEIAPQHSMIAILNPSQYFPICYKKLDDLSTFQTFNQSKIGAFLWHSPRWLTFPLKQLNKILKRKNFIT